MKHLCLVSVSPKESKNRFWLEPFLLKLQEEQTFSERWQLPVTRLGALLAGGVGVISVIGLTYWVVALTPLREQVVPGYLAEEARVSAKQAEILTQTLSKELEQQTRYLHALKSILQEGVPEEFGLLAFVDSLAGAESAVDSMGTQLTPEDSALRARLAEEDRFALQRGRTEEAVDRSIPFLPIEGEVSSNFDVASGHHGIDFVAPIGTIVHAVDDGTVILASYTVDGGYVIAIQHSRNRLSIYKHNASLMHEIGDPVQVGDPIAVLGGTGTHSSGPHLHFEWWVNGSPLNPAIWLPKPGMTGS
jgi:murein DD-endopeptidase MepM/ murein hydrolase activator NlpD